MKFIKIIASNKYHENAKWETVKSIVMQNFEELKGMTYSGDDGEDTVGESTVSWLTSMISAWLKQGLSKQAVKDLLDESWNGDYFDGHIFDRVIEIIDDIYQDLEIIMDNISLNTWSEADFSELDRDNVPADPVNKARWLRHFRGNIVHTIIRDLSMDNVDPHVLDREPYNSWSDNDMAIFLDVLSNKNELYSKPQPKPSPQSNPDDEYVERMRRFFNIR